MEIVFILRSLLRWRLLVAAVAAIAVTIGYLLAFQPSLPPKTRGYTVGIATARILVDTPRSQVVDINPEGSDALGSRASVLANLMVDGEVKDAIAAKAGLKAEKLLAATEASGGTDAVMPKGGLQRSTYVLTTGVLINSDMVELPIIKVQTQAPTPQKAAKLADAAVEGLDEYLDSKATSEQIASGRRLQVTGLGPAQASESSRGPKPIMGAMVALLLFAAGCGLIVGISALATSWRKAVADDEARYSAEFDDLMHSMELDDDLLTEPVAKRG